MNRRIDSLYGNLDPDKGNKDRIINPTSLGSDILTNLGITPRLVPERVRTPGEILDEQRAAVIDAHRAAGFEVAEALRFPTPSAAPNLGLSSLFAPRAEVTPDPLFYKDNISEKEEIFSQRHRSKFIDDQKSGNVFGTENSLGLSGLLADRETLLAQAANRRLAKLVDEHGAGNVVSLAATKAIADERNLFGPDVIVFMVRKSGDSAHSEPAQTS